MEREGGSWTEPHWEKKRGEVVALEKGTLYGLPVYSGRTVSFSKHDLKLSREIFIREALVEGDMDLQAPFFRHNQALIREIRDLEQKSRRPDVLVDDEAIFAFYDGKLGADVCDAVSLETWRKEAEAKEPKILWLTRDELMRHGAEGITLEDGDITDDAIEYASPTDKKQIGIEIRSGRHRIVRHSV